jgi:hypothetical protein
VNSLNNDISKGHWHELRLEHVDPERLTVPRPTQMWVDSLTTVHLGDKAQWTVKRVWRNMLASDLLAERSSQRHELMGILPHVFLRCDRVGRCLYPIPSPLGICWHYCFVTVLRWWLTLKGRHLCLAENLCGGMDNGPPRSSTSPSPHPGSVLPHTATALCRCDFVEDPELTRFSKQAQYIYKCIRRN